MHKLTKKERKQLTMGALGIGAAYALYQGYQPTSTQIMDTSPRMSTSYQYDQYSPIRNQPYKPPTMHMFGPAPAGQMFGGTGLGHAWSDYATGKTAGAVLGVLAVQFVLGRYVAAPIIGKATKKKLTTGQSNGVGVAAMLL